MIWQMVVVISLVVRPIQYSIDAFSALPWRFEEIPGASVPSNNGVVQGKQFQPPCLRAAVTN